MVNEWMNDGQEEEEEEELVDVHKYWQDREL